MKTYKFSELTANALNEIVQVNSRGTAAYPWTKLDSIVLTDDERMEVQRIISRLRYRETNLMNEATIWSRAIYPLLVMAEQATIQAWAEITLDVTYPHAALQGTLDGALAGNHLGDPGTPYLIIAEAKRGIAQRDPRFQLYGQLLAVAHKNWEKNQQEPQEVFGCYTIGDNWTFARAEVVDIETERPQMSIELSQEYAQKAEAEAILKVLKLIVARYEPLPM